MKNTMCQGKTGSMGGDARTTLYFGVTRKGVVVFRNGLRGKDARLGALRDLERVYGRPATIGGLAPIIMFTASEDCPREGRKFWS